MSSTTTIPTISREDFWDPLSADHPDLLYELVSRMEALLLLPPRERCAALAALLDLEAAMPQSSLREFLGAELRALNAMAPAGAAEVVESLEALQRAQPAEYSMRRSIALQGACRDLSAEELSSLEAVMPNARAMAGLPPRQILSHANGHNGSKASAGHGHNRSPVARLFGRA